MIFENAMVEPFSRIGANTILRAGVHLSNDAVIGDHVFLAPRVAMAGTRRLDSHSLEGVHATQRTNSSVRSEQRRVGKAGASQGPYRWWQYPFTQNLRTSHTQQ